MNLSLLFVGLLLLLTSLAGIGLGLFVATDPNTRESGRYFALWWVPAAAAAGVLMRDGVTFLVGLLCFLVAGAVFAFEGRRSGSAFRRGDLPGEARPGKPGGGTRGAPVEAIGASERTTRENTVGRRRRRAS